jgi:hypothetical protein
MADIRKGYTSLRNPVLMRLLWKMVNQLIVGTLTWFHIFSVIGWSGAALTFLVTIKPSLAKFSPQASGEFILKTLPRFVRAVQVFSVLTLIFGPSLAYTMADGPPNAFDLKSPWSISIVIGAAIGITAFLVVFLLLTPTAKKLTTLITKMRQTPQQPPPAQLQKLQKRLAIIPPLAVSLLLATEVFMVAAAQF